MSKVKELIIGIDPGKHTGAVLYNPDKDVILRSSEVMPPPDDVGSDYKPHVLLGVYRVVSELIESALNMTEAINVTCALEAPYINPPHKSKATGKRISPYVDPFVGEVRGVVMLACAPYVDVMYIPILTTKKVVSGSGTAKRGEIHKIMVARFGSKVIGSDHIAFAAAYAVTLDSIHAARDLAGMKGE